MNTERFASRKFIAAFAVVLAAVLLTFGIISPEIWSSFTTWVIGMYFTGNVAERWVAAGNPNLPVATTKELLKD